MARFGGGMGHGGSASGGGPGGAGLGPGFAGGAGMGGGPGVWRRMRDAPRPTRPVWPTLKRALPLLRHYKIAVFFYLVTIAFTSLAGTTITLFPKGIIDTAIGHKSDARLYLLCSEWLALILLQAGVTTLQSFLSNVVAHGVMFDLRSRLYRHLTGMSLRWFTANRTGEVLSRISNDVSGIQSVITDTIGGVLGNVLTVGSAFIVMLAIDWRLAIGSMISIPLFLIPARKVGQMQRVLVTETQEQMAGMNSQMQETLSVSGALLVKTFGRQTEEIETFQDTAGNIRDLNIRRAMVGRWFNMAMGLFSQLAPALVYGYLGHRVIEGQASVGDVVTLSLLLQRLFGPISQLMSLNITVLSSLALFERIFDYLDLDHDIKDRPGAVDLDRRPWPHHLRPRRLRLRRRPSHAARRLVRRPARQLRRPRRPHRRRQNHHRLPRAAPLRRRLGRRAYRRPRRPRHHAWRRSAKRYRWSTRSRSSFTPRSARTCVTPAPTPATRRFKRPPRPRTSTTS